jgi:hypothetical protein
MIFSTYRIVVERLASMLNKTSLLPSSLLGTLAIPKNGANILGEKQVRVYS